MKIEGDCPLILLIYRFVKAETRAVDVKKAHHKSRLPNLPDGALPHTCCIHFQAEAEIDNSADTLFVILALSEASSLAIWFLEPMELFRHIFKVPVGHHFLESCDEEYPPKSMTTTKY